MSVCHCKVQVNRKNGFGAVPCLRVQFRECYIIPSPRPFLLGSCSTNIRTYTRTHNSEKEEEEERRRRMVEIEKVLHMNGGDGNTSYAINSLHPVSPLSLSLSLSLSLNIVFSYISISFLLFLEDGGIYGQAYTRREH